MSEPKYIIGIDLGTSNCALAHVELAGGRNAAVRDFAVPQLRRLGEVAARPLLPSCLYIPHEQELPPGSTTLPWGESGGLVAGEFARWQGARTPGRLVASAKSWLCHAGVDRSAPILPWGAPADVRKVSPVEASSQYLAHLARAWNLEHPDSPMAEQEVVITVPASFDEVARSLTVQAARAAGLEKFTLVEEPQAAFYDFTARRRNGLALELRGLRLVLVVDVGGGTSDFTLIQIDASTEPPTLKRIAVGDHLMLGGDNMDAAIARRVEERLLASGKKLSATQWTQLVQAARLAKESLLGESAPAHHIVSVAAEGSRLLGGSISCPLTREEAEQLVLEGFFPAAKADETPRRAARVGLQELGLPYAPDPAITRNLAAFLRLHAKSGFEALAAGEGRVPQGPLPRPDAILLNGGVFNSKSMAERLVEVVSSWWPESPRVPVLAHDSLELAVARGAAYYGLARKGFGQKITGGAAHAFYVGLGTKGSAETPMALCLIPRGFEEGETVELKDRTFTLTLGKPVQFPLFTTTVDRVDPPGHLAAVSEDLHPLPPLHTLLKSNRIKGDKAPVFLKARLTEIGTLELWCVSCVGEESWRLEFELRGAETERPVSVAASMPARFAEARTWVETIYGKPAGQSAKAAPAAEPSRSANPPPKDVKQLWSCLERTMGGRESWPVPALRELWSALHAGAARRRRSAEHERIFYQLTGHTLRPGFGYPLDEWRCEQTFHLFPENVEFHKEKVVWLEYWIMWRRLAGGLGEARQNEMWQALKPHLIHRLSPQSAKHLPKPKGIQPEGFEEMLRALASFEHLPALDKMFLGDSIVERLKNQASQGGPWVWSLGRLGARAPLYGSAHKVVSPECATGWLGFLLAKDIRKIDGAPYAAAQMARMTGDRSRDLAESVRRAAAATLVGVGAPATWVKMVSEVVPIDKADEYRALGDALPAGLQLRET